MEIGQGSLIPMGAPSTILGFVQRAEGKHFLGSAAEPEAVPKFLAAFQSHAELFDRAFSHSRTNGPSFDAKARVVHSLPVLLKVAEIAMQHDARMALGVARLGFAQAEGFLLEGSKNRLDLTQPQLFLHPLIPPRTAFGVFTKNRLGAQGQVFDSMVPIQNEDRLLEMEFPQRLQDRRAI